MGEKVTGLAIFRSDSRLIACFLRRFSASLGRSLRKGDYRSGRSAEVIWRGSCGADVGRWHRGRMAIWGDEREVQE